MSLLEFCRWLQYSAPLHSLRESPIFFPIVATIHLMGLALIGGSVLMVDLRLLGWGVQGQPASRVTDDAERWLRIGLVVMVSTGILLFMCFATKYYYLTFFWVKMAALVAVVVFTRSVHRRVALANEADVSPSRRRLVALVSLFLWTTVAIGGRYIGFP